MTMVLSPPLSPSVDAADLTAANENAVLAVRHAHKNDDGVSANRDTADY